ncbi:MAG: PQQ-binding-like beta-propeller repeat protein [Planctomycetes bacterium]|nr:PQQ-binding-like beta-propeller repeat protein [Planctomycetota bacterium]
MTRTRAVVVSCLILALAVATLALAAGALAKEGDVTKPEGEWPLFRGNPLQTGVAASALPDRLRVRWKFRTADAVEGTAAVASGTVYVGSYDKHVHALDLKTGRQKWKYEGGPFKAPLAWRDGAVYAGDEDGTFHCIDARTGAKRWTFDAGAEVTSGAGFAGDDVLFGAGNEMLYCLTKDGKKKWTFRVEGGPVNATPAVAGGRTFVAGCDSNLHVIDTKTGREVRAVPLNGQVGSTGAVVGDMLYVGTMTNEVQAVDWKNGKVEWSFKAKTRQQPFFASVAVTDDLVLAGSKDKRIYGLDRKTGNEVWSYLTEGRVDSSPVVVGKRVYVGSQDRNLYVLDRDRGTLIQKIELDGEVVGSPAVAGGCLVIGTVKGTVYCLGE